MEFSTKTIEFEKCSIKAQIWDTAGQERFENMTKIYFRDAVGAALVYDICRRDSFNNLKTTWLTQIREHAHADIPMILGEQCLFPVLPRLLTDTWLVDDSWQQMRSGGE